MSRPRPDFVAWQETTYLPLPINAYETLTLVKDLRGATYPHLQNRLLSMEIISLVLARDPDGPTRHAVVSALTGAGRYKVETTTDKQLLDELKGLGVVNRFASHVQLVS